MWVDAFHEGFKTPAQVDNLFERAQMAHVNALFVQVRARAAAYHNSVYDPPAPDKEPGFDALAYALQKAKGTPIQVHAWINAHPLWPTTQPPPPGHVVLTHPEWLTEDSKGKKETDVGYALDFGNPDAADYLWRTYMEVVRNYPVAGIHMDFIRFSSPDSGYNPVSVARFANLHNASPQDPTDPLWTTWRRDQVTAFVRKLYATSAAVRWDAIVSAALIPWGDAPREGRPWEDCAPMKRALQDWRAWMNEGVLDIGMPMLYANPVKLPTYLDGWLGWLRSQPFSSKIVTGFGPYMNTPQETLRQIASALPLGFCLFSYASTSDRGAGIQEYEDEVYRAVGETGAWQAPPALPWKTQPQNGIVYGTVIDYDMSPVDGGTVMLLDNAGNRYLSTTDGTGFYAFFGLPPGRYSVQIERFNPNRARSVSLETHWDRVRVMRGLAASGHIVLAPGVARLGAAVDGDTVVLRDAKVVSTNPLTLRERIGSRTVVVREAKPPILRWVVGDTVAARGVYRRRELVDATVRILGP